MSQSGSADAQAPPPTASTGGCRHAVLALAADGEQTMVSSLGNPTAMADETEATVAAELIEGPTMLSPSDSEQLDDDIPSLSGDAPLQGFPAGWNPELQPSAQLYPIFYRFHQHPSTAFMTSPVQSSFPAAPSQNQMSSLAVETKMCPRPAIMEKSGVHGPGGSVPTGRRRKLVANRIKLSNFSPKEDVLVVKSWLEVSCESVLNTGKKRDRFWSRILSRYNEKRGLYPERSLRSLQSRWDHIKADVGKFAAHLANVLRDNPSGMSDADKTSLALANFADIEQFPFVYMHCWDLLKDEPKWKEINHKGPRHGNANPSTRFMPSPVQPSSPAEPSPNQTSPLAVETEMRPRLAVMEDSEGDGPGGSVPTGRQHKLVAKRIKLSNFSPKEDVLLVKSWLKISYEPVVNTGKKRDGFWSRVMSLYNEKKNPYPERSIRSLQSRWEHIKAEGGKFSAHVANVLRDNPRGMSDTDKTYLALAKFADVEQHPFIYIHCWDLLKDEPKWKDINHKRPRHGNADPSTGFMPFPAQPSSPATPDQNQMSPPTVETEVYPGSTVMEEPQGDGAGAGGSPATPDQNQMSPPTVETEMYPGSTVMEETEGDGAGEGGSPAAPDQNQMSPLTVETEMYPGSAVIEETQGDGDGARGSVPTGQLSKVVANRSRLPNFSPNEDVFLVKSWLEISCGPIITTGQTRDGFWLRILSRYNEKRGQYPERSIRSLQSRWELIKAEGGKFEAHVANVLQDNPSEMSDDDKTSLALAKFAYFEQHPFVYIHCWDLLKDEPKWKEINHKGPRHGSDDPSTGFMPFPAQPSSALDQNQMAPTTVETEMFPGSTVMEESQGNGVGGSVPTGGQSMVVASCSKLPNFSPMEDVLLVKSWLEISCDPIVSTGQTRDGFWCRITSRYNEKRGLYPERSIRMLQSRWELIKAEVGKFSAFVANVLRDNPSRMSDADKTSLAQANFADAKQYPFAYMHCWDLLKEEPKWMEIKHKGPERSDDDVITDYIPPTSNTIIDLDPEILSPNSVGVKRPMLGDAAKAAAKKSGSSCVSASSSQDASELQDLLLQKIAIWQEENMKRMAAIEKRYEELCKHNESIFNLEQQKVQLMRDKLEMQRLKEQKLEEERILGINLDNCTPPLRVYYQAKQEEILQKIEAGRRNNSGR